MRPRLRLSFEVSGTPIPQGSKRAWLNSQTGKVMMTEASGTKHHTWRAEVTGQARQAMANLGRFENPFREPVSCSLTFQFHRPLSHYGTGRNSEVIKGSATPFPVKPPDLDKLTRAIWDSLTSVVWVDDAQVVAATIKKQWVERWQEEGVLILVGTFNSHEGETDGVE